jgi:lipopolysaccharide/colanic/teichoic acid biosynthesis glycosyltransferase
LRSSQRELAHLIIEDTEDVAPVPEYPAKKTFPHLKRTLDLFLAGVGLAFFAPAWMIIALLIKLEDGGPIFYGQERVGRNGRSFWSWKFRSMVPDSDDLFGPRQAMENDQRITRVGRFLRRTNCLSSGTSLKGI